MTTLIGGGLAIAKTLRKASGEVALAPQSGARFGCAAGMIAAVVAMACSGAAHSQSADGSAKRLSYSVNANAAYFSNLAGGNDQIAALRQVTPADMVYSAGMTGSFQSPGARTNFFINAGAQINRHADNQNLDGEDYSVSSGVTARAGTCGATLVGSFSRAQTAPENLIVAVTDNISQSTSGSISLSCGTGSIVSSLSRSVNRVTNSGVGLIGTSSRSVGGAVGYSNATLGTLSVTADYSQSDFSQSPIPARAAPEAPKQYGAGLSYSRKISQRLSGSAAVSFVKIESGGGSSDGVNSNIAMNYRLSQRSSLTLGYDRGTHASQSIYSILTRSESLNLGATYNLSRRIHLNAAINGQKSNFEGGIITPLQVRENRSLSESVGAGLTIGRNINLGLNAGHSERSADVSQFNFSSDSVSISISSTF